MRRLIVPADLSPVIAEFDLRSEFNVRINKRPDIGRMLVCAYYYAVMDKLLGGDLEDDYFSQTHETRFTLESLMTRYCRNYPALNYGIQGVTTFGRETILRIKQLDRDLYEVCCD